jgi:gamma-glutamyltranspeptidase/glutathione hydrolase
VLLGPIAILAGGIAQGARAFDGRQRQPGIGTKRPRGFPADSPIPAAARVAVPTAIAAAVVAHAYGGGESLRAVVRPGIEAAERAGASERAAWLERLSRVGASSLAEPLYRRALLRAGSSGEGGLLTPSDLELPTDLDLRAEEVALDGERWLRAPWVSQQPTEFQVAGAGQGVCAADSHGGLAALLYRISSEGVLVEELELIAPLAAEPVRRGVPRVAPGARLCAPSPMALRMDSAERPITVMMEPERRELSARASDARFRLSWNPATRLVSH